MKILLFTIFLCILSAINGQQPQCKDIGEYCQYHNDCCSGNCLTFSYKCIKKRDEGSVMEQMKPVPNELQTTITDRLGESSPSGQSGPQTVSVPPHMRRPPGSCYVNGQSCSYSLQCCSGTCSHITNMCMTETASGPIETPNRISVGDIQPLSCLVIGDKCYNNVPNECCLPLKCHGYYHRCVT